MSFAVLEKKDGSGYFVAELRSGESPLDLEGEYSAKYVTSFPSLEAAEAKRDQLNGTSDPRWTS